MTITPATLTAVAIGGAIGAVTRFYCASMIIKHFPHEIPIATLIINLSGSFIIGILVALFIHFTPSDILKGFLITGFLGALTTYSTFAIESYILLNSSFYYGILNIVSNALGTVVAAALGFKLIETLIR
ncbi:MAG: fluoride efflux transporter CrcB [Campylobacterota bacterium]|nr:fluoride efflux transporter CrcB [Campylobacterota bacterium]